MAGPEIPLTGSIGLVGDAALLGVAVIDIANTDYVLTPAEAAAFVIVVTSSVAMTTQRRVLAPKNEGQIYFVMNATEQGFDINFTTGGGGSTTNLVTIPAQAGDVCFYTAEWTGGSNSDGGYFGILSNNQTGFFITDTAGNSAFADLFGGNSGNLAEIGYADSNDNNIIIVSDTTSDAAQLAIQFSDGNNTHNAEIYMASGNMEYIVTNRTGGVGNHVFQGTDGAGDTIWELSINGDTADDGGVQIQSTVGSILVKPTASPGHLFTAPTITDQTLNRAFGSSYKNTTAQYMQVSGWGVTSGSSVGQLSVMLGTSAADTEAYRNENTASVSGAAAGFCFTVPPGMFYQINVSGDIGSLGKWVEMLY